jgi:site-specific DNA-methyltransferase (adenine-specific)
MKVPTSYNPDVLTCLANLSNDEVFTPPSLVNQMLDTLPSELWKDKDAKFLDPVSKSGVFLREIARRLMEGLADEIPDIQERIDHIYQNQLYGIAITELTALLARRSLYCSKTANGKYAIGRVFKNEHGNIRFTRVKHSWKDGKCVHCNANQAEYDRSDLLESHAYEFIHTDEPSKLFNGMKFQVIVGNPPYQLSDGGFGTSATPIYHRFVEQAKKLNPRYLTMIIPARWYSGGKGLDDFRDSMLTDNSIRRIVDFPEASDAFSGVQIKGGVCFFLWDRDNKGDCEVFTSRKGQIVSEMMRPLLEEGCETFIRFNEAIAILKKIQKKKEASLAHQVSARKPFGLETTFKGRPKEFEGSVTLYQNGGVGYIKPDLIKNNAELVELYKVLIPPLGSGSDSFPHQILGKPFIAGPGSACTETYLVSGAFKSKKEAENLKKYLTTRFLRFLVLLNKPTQHATSKVYQFVPVQDFKEDWNDEKLYKKYGITKEEVAFIESLIRPMDI